MLDGSAGEMGRQKFIPPGAMIGLRRSQPGQRQGTFVLPLHPLRRGTTHKGSQTCLIVLYVPPVVAQSLSYSGPALTQSLGRLSTLLISASPLIVT